VNGRRTYGWWPWLVFLLMLGWAGWTAWTLQGARREEARLRARFEELLQPVEAFSRREEPLALEELPDLYDRLLARALELELEVVEVDPGLEEGTVTLEGDFEAAYRMLDVVRELDYPVWVKGIEIARSDDRGERLTVTFTLGVRLEPPDEGYDLP